MAGVSPCPDIVPAPLLERPHRDEAGRLERDLAALQLDPYLRRLASQEGRCRRVLGTLGQEFLRRRAYEALGFARVDDYARERLGVSGRELQSIVRVVAAMKALPVLAGAFDRGQLSWTQLRLLVPVARPDTEDAWLALAAGRTVRALEALIRAGVTAPPEVESIPSELPLREGCGAPATTSAVGADVASPVAATNGAAPSIATDTVRAATAALEECAEDGDVVDGECETLVRLRCPRSVARLWREVVDLASRMAGEPLCTWRAAEVIAAEGLSAATSAEPTCAEIINSFSGARLDLDPSETRAVFAARACFDTIDWAAVVEALPAEVDALARDVTACDAHALDARLQAVTYAMRRIDWQMGRLLRLFLDCRLHTLLGFATAARYVRERLGLSIRKVRMLVALERKTWDAPALMEVYRAGTLSSLRALTIAPVISERHGAAWVTRAREVTLRRLTEEVVWALDVQDSSAGFMWPAPPSTGTPLVAPERQMRAWQDEVPSAEIRLRGPLSVIALFRNAVAVWREPCTPEWLGLLRLLVHVKMEWERQPRHRDPVFERDGWRCAVPACRGRRNLHDHHIVFRSRGGDNARDNRVSVCAWHHLRGIHTGRVRAWGEAPADVHWELGVRRDGPPLARFVGDHYVPQVERDAVGAVAPTAGSALARTDGTSRAPASLDVAEHWESERKEAARSAGGA